MCKSEGLLLLLLLAVTGAEITVDFPCFDDTWTYSEVSGKCYKTSSTAKKNHDDAKAVCAAALTGSSQASVTLSSFQTGDEIDALVSALNSLNYRADIWLGIRRQSSTAPYKIDGTDTQVNLNSLFKWSGGTGSGDCLLFSFQSTDASGNFVSEKNIFETACTEEKHYVCEHNVPKCSDPPGQFKPDIHVLEPNTLYPVRAASRRVLTAKCKVGLYPEDLTQTQRNTDAKADASLAYPKYRCSGRRLAGSTTSADPARFETSFTYSGFDLTACVGIQCQFDYKLLAYVDVSSFTEADNKRYDHGAKIDVQCSKGYVYFRDHTTRAASLTCAQSTTNAKLGVWNPEDLGVCKVIRCNGTKLNELLPKGASFTGARSLLTQREYGPLERNQFDRYGNVVTIKCDEGTFFPDRSTEKQVHCGLADNSETVGLWRAYAGGSLPLPPRCIGVTCLNQGAIAKTGMRLLPNFLITFVDKSTRNLTVHTEDSYEFGTRIKFTCEDTYETINQESEQTIVCSTGGAWKPQLSNCLGKTLAINTTQGSRYAPPPVEAESASQLGGVVIAVIVVFFAVLLLLDLTTIKRDFNMMRNNLRLQKRRIKRLVNKKKKTDKTSQEDAANSDLPEEQTALEQSDISSK